ncbi:hypothetical protein ACHWQZ_G019054 [Mnemiopsis leidyi]
MGSCCSNVVRFNRDLKNDLRWKCTNFSCRNLNPCGSCFCKIKDDSDTEPMNRNSCSCQTEEVVFKIMQDSNKQLCFHNGDPHGVNKRDSNWSTQAQKCSTVSLLSTNTNRKSSTGPTRSIEEILTLIERLQDICSQSSLTDQVSLLCTISYLREYCLLLNQGGMKRLKRKSVAFEFDEILDESSGAAEFWVSAFIHKNKEQGINRFKKVATAVRTAIALAGITRHSSVDSDSAMVDLPFTINNNDETSDYLKSNLLSWDFDQFLFDKLTNHHGISRLFLEILQATNLLSEFNISRKKVIKFCVEVEKGYKLYNNPYHNGIHGADVLQTTYFILLDTKISDWLSSLELLSLLFAAMIHDLEHTGTNNIFHKHSSSELAQLYNDKSVLENHHVSRAYQLLSDPELNPFEAMSRSQFLIMREIVVDCVLATDMADHFSQVSTLKDSLIDLSLIDRQDVMNSILHCSDIAGPGKMWSIHETWTQLLMQEFFAQGDKEKDMNLPISPLCDRTTTNIPESQVGFITYITTPAFTALGNTIDAILREKEEQEFLELSTPWVKNRRKSSVASQMTPIEENPAYQSRTPSSLKLRAKRSQTGNLGGNASFLYKPINRIWDKHFQFNLERWKEKLKEEMTD